MLDDAAKFLLRAGQKAGNIFESDQRDIEGVAEADEACTFQRSIDVENAGEERRLIGDNADGAPIEARKPDNNILCKVLMDLEKIAVIHDGVDGVLDVIRLLGIRRDERIQSFIAAIRRIRGLAARRVCNIVRREKT